MTAIETLVRLNESYRVQGDRIRCLAAHCHQQQMITSIDEDFPHRETCPCFNHPKVSKRPWRDFLEAACEASGYRSDPLPRLSPERIEAMYSFGTNLRSNLPEESLDQVEANIQVEAGPSERPWKPLSELEFDQTRAFHVVIRWESLHSYRWYPYKRGSSQFQHGIKGRWQKVDDYGLGWSNANLPEVGMWTPAENNRRSGS